MRDVADEAVRLVEGPAAGVEVGPALDVAEEALVVRLHVRPPDRRRPREAPRRAAAVPLAHDLLGPHLALAVDRGRAVVGVGRRRVADPADELRRREDRPPDGAGRADGLAHVLHADRVVVVVRQRRAVEVGPRGEVDDGVGPLPLEHVLQRLRLEDVEDVLPVPRPLGHQVALVDGDDVVAVRQEQVGDPPADEAVAPGDEDASGRGRIRAHAEVAGSGMGVDGETRGASAARSRRIRSQTSP